MFRDSIQSSAYTLATAAAEKGMALNPLPNSFLDTLVTLAKNQQSLEHAAGEGEVRLAAAQSPLDMYNLTVDELAVSAAQVVIRNLNLARTDAVVLINRVVEGFKEIINPAIPYAYSQVRVIAIQYPELLSSEYVRSILDRGDTDDLGVSEGIVLSPEEEQYQDLIALAKTGLSNVDAQIDQLTLGMTAPELRGLFEAIFKDGYLGGISFDYDTFQADLRNILLAYLWATKLRTADYMPSKSRYSKLDYDNRLANLQSFAARNLKKVITRREFDARNDQLVLGLGYGSVYVNEDLYAAWLSDENGGKPEILLGAGLESSDAVTRTSKELLEDGERYIRAWNTYVSTVAETRRQDLRNVARAEMFTLIKTIIQERQAEGVMVEGNTAVHLLDDRCMNFSTLDLNNPYPVLRDLVLDIFYVNSDVPQIVRYMDELAASDPKLTADDLATLATCRYVTKFSSRYIVLTPTAI